MKQEETVRIAQIIGKWVGGGVEAVVMNYYRHIDRSKIQFDFICDEDSTNIPYEEIESLGGKVILIPPYQKPFSYHFKLKKVLKDGNYKIVHSHINTMSLFSLFAAWCARVPVRIAHSHSTSNPKETIKNIMKLILRPFCRLFATDYMCCSEFAGRWLFGNNSYDNGKVYLMNNAIELNKYKYDSKVRTKKRKELKIKDDTLVVGHIGRFVDQKNHTFLIDIFNELHKKNPDSILLLVGQGPLVEKTKDKVDSLELTDSVVFFGQRDDANEFYQAFDVFALPSLYEGLGMVLVEAQCAGCYCVASTEVPSAAKIADSLEFIDLSSSEKIWAEKILENIKGYSRKEQTKNGAKAGYDIEIEAKKLLSKYNEYK